MVGFSGLLIAFLLLLGVSTPSFAASTGDLDLSGTVSATCDITVTPIAGVADNLPFGSPQSDLVVGSVSETCNDADGYTLSAVSSNSSVLLPLGTSPDSLAYTFRYGGVLVDLTAGSVQVTDASAATGSGGVSKLMHISYPNPGFIAADTYADTIVFTIAAK